MALHAILKPFAAYLIGMLLFPVVSFGQHSSYAGQQARDIKALSSQELQGYLSGHGMGFAKAAELNRYPGPKHVLELADQLRLTEQQHSQTRYLYESMRQEAVQWGTKLVEEERRLNHLFTTQAITEATLQDVMRNIARYRGELRQTHLRAHLAQQRLLTAHQLQRYDVLRGYTSAMPHHHQH